MSRKLAYLAVVALFAHMSTGCHIFERIAWRIRSCHGCSPQFSHPGYGGPVMDGGPMYGGAPCGDCSSCASGYGGTVISGTVNPAVTMPNPPSVGVPMPEKK